jgi:hypothetical protein
VNIIIAILVSMQMHVGAMRGSCLDECGDVGARVEGCLMTEMSQLDHTLLHIRIICYGCVVHETVIYWQLLYGMLMCHTLVEKYREGSGISVTSQCVFVLIVMLKP